MSESNPETTDKPGVIRATLQCAAIGLAACREAWLRGYDEAATSRTTKLDHIKGWARLLAPPLMLLATLILMAVFHVGQ